MSHLPSVQSLRSLFPSRRSARNSAAAEKSAAKSRQPGSRREKTESDNSFPRLLIPALVLVLFFLAARVCFVHSFPAFLFSEDKKFERFTESVFRSEMNGNTLSRHYTVAEPSRYRLDTKHVTLGDASPVARQEALATAENYLNTLNSFDQEKLSAQHRLTCSIFRDYLESELAGADYLLYDEPLSPSLGIQAQLPVLLAEYAFRTKGDIEDYLTLLAQIPDYFSSVLAYEKAKADEGLFMSRACAEEVIRQCSAFIADPESNYLTELFDEKIDAVKNLTVDEKIAYKSRSRSILTGYVIPAYETLIRVLGTFSDRGTNTQGLYYFPKGKEYYRCLVRRTVGDDRSIEEIEEAIKVQLVADFAAIQELLKQYPAGAADSGTLPGDPAAMLSELRQKITQDFPVLPDVSCEVKYVHESLQNYLSPAFYLTSPIDDCTDNVIYINPAGDCDELELFTTLAHEGYPGHLYQSVYFNTQKPDLLRSILDTGGYTEGWATYVEMYAYSLWTEDPLFAALSQRNRSFTLGLASLLDIGIHYRGYSPTQVNTFLKRLGFSQENAESLYRTILESPANYLQYYVGYLNFCSLRDEMKAALGDRFSLREFHRLVLETGPAPFYILREQILPKGEPS